MGVADVLYRSRVDLTLTYGDTGNLERETQRPGAERVLSRRTPVRPPAVLLPKALYLDVLRRPSRNRTGIDANPMPQGLLDESDFRGGEERTIRRRQCRG